MARNRMWIMPRATRPAWILPAVLALLGAGASQTPEDSVRRGNVAYTREDYAAAVEHYTRAEARITDPGLAAYNKAASLYRLGHFRDAELHYRRARSDAEGARLPRALFGLGNSLVQRAQDRDADALREAVDCFEQCLRSPDADPELAESARHNLELAKLLWLQARSRPDKANDDRPPQSDDPRARPPGADRDPRHGASERGPGVPDPSGEPSPVKLEPGQDPVAAAQQPAPGAGQLPAVPDRADLVPMASEDAAEHLQRAAARVLSERREHRQRMARPPSVNVLDW